MSYLLMLAALSGFAAHAQTFRAGAAQVDISPRAFPVVVNCGMQERSAERLTVPLCARALVLDDGKTTRAIVVVDSCMMP
ncbi:MAG: hypothetical protein JNL62_16625, partial [Bryobacterales bacterium]|nr:hypothetical protein [Bryobacterales bacterium]